MVSVSTDSAIMTIGGVSIAVAVLLGCFFVLGIATLAASPLRFAHPLLISARLEASKNKYYKLPGTDTTKNEVENNIDNSDINTISAENVPIHSDVQSTTDLDSSSKDNTLRDNKVSMKEDISSVKYGNTNLNGLNSANPDAIDTRIHATEPGTDMTLDKVKQAMANDPRVHMTVPELVRSYSYGVEIHHVVTMDGYVLELHRVLGKQNHTNCSSFAEDRQQQKGKCEPVLLQHGLLGSSSAWVMNDPDKALAYILADRGYDVWLGNARGNIYSMNHTYFNVRSWKYWDFSFDEMGKFDLPAVIDYILKTTSYDKLHYIGHSMGTTMFWVMESEHPGYSNKVASMSALGPVAYVSNAESPIVLLAPFNRQLQWILIDLLGEYRFMDPNFILTKLTEEACTALELTELICSNTIFMLIGFDNKDLNLEWLPVILAQLNAGASTKTLIHFAQLVQSGTFVKFDYGWGNHRQYNSSSPPSYDLKRVTTPVLLIGGKNDWLADPTDVEHLRKGLTNAEVEDHPVTNPKFNHLDFLWGKDAAKLVYEDVYNFMRNHTI